jgi:iron(III) transport system substrate-binding protein
MKGEGDMAVESGSWRSFMPMVLLFLLAGGALPSSSLGAEAWSDIVAAARKEGKVVVYGPPGAHIRDALTKDFLAKYPEIQVEYTGGSNPQLTPKLVNEAKAGLRIADVHLGGTASPITELMPLNILAPIQPFFAGPESRDAAKWHGGKFEFADKAGKYVVVLAMLAHPGFAYNPKLVDVKSIKSWKDFLQPKWKGKLSMWEPRRPGAGLALAAFAFNSPEVGLGKEYLSQLFKQQIVFHASENDRQALEWVASGKFPINLATSTRTGQELIAKGLPIAYGRAGAFPEGTWTTPGSASVTVITGAPHPNATKVYLDWLLSKDAQLAWSKASGYPSLRLDVPNQHVPAQMLLREGERYVADYKEIYVTGQKDEVMAWVSEETRKQGY